MDTTKDRLRGLIDTLREATKRLQEDTKNNEAVAGGDNNIRLVSDT